MKHKTILIVMAVLAILVVTYALWYSYERREKLAQAHACNDALNNPPKPTMVTGPDGNPAPLYSVNGCVMVVVPPSLLDILRGHMIFTNMPQRMKVNPYSLTDILLGRYIFGPSDIGCDQSATTTDCASLPANAQPLDSAPRHVTLSGTYQCLPYRDANAPHHDDCVFGIKTDDGVYYMVNFGQSAESMRQFTQGAHITAEGFTVIKEALNTDQWNAYDMAGIFTITRMVGADITPSTDKSTK